MTPILYSFRRCPYAIRARLAIASSGQEVKLREILLRDKPAAFLAASPSATVPCLVTETEVIDESLDVMKWALNQSDPEDLLSMPDEGHALIDRCDGPFKQALDRTKYASRHPDHDPEIERAKAMGILSDLTPRLDRHRFLFGPKASLADLAVLPFLRQFAMIDKARFDHDAPDQVRIWLDNFLESQRLADVMQKFPVWSEGDEPLRFPVGRTTP
ncbi:glutathione S-transferase [Aliiroseovarius sp. KMU-50]|uniref:Glutathione S-transferase n=1 Tax=Aliiroseovarius salicola TaxID=3009082 RepID=A0ABT4VYK5_9RHOB|nr:glutathione S-transferase [Aliiroseovarius sp. KMU-50]MDA5092815.1 glutathione S-transferase [Aliiroseovarius sp. KMU-50]